MEPKTLTTDTEGPIYFDFDDGCSQKLIEARRQYRKFAPKDRSLVEIGEQTNRAVTEEDIDRIIEYRNWGRAIGVAIEALSFWPSRRVSETVTSIIVSQMANTNLSEEFANAGEAISIYGWEGTFQRVRDRLSEVGWYEELQNRNRCGGCYVHPDAR